MSKELEKKSFKELGRLFPITISEYDPAWNRLYLTEKAIIEKTVGIESIIRINHFGSTSIPNMKSKPIIDVLLEIREKTEKEEIISSLKKIKYLYTPKPENPAPHMMFMKGYTLEGFRGQAYHVHVRYIGDWDELYFRDYLILYPDIARKYESLKFRLKEKYEYDREAYTQGKTDFIQKVIILARKELGNKYVFDRSINREK